jgi:hypothetical protein
MAPGSEVRITANCADGSSSATVTSIAFGTLTILPEGSVMTGQAFVPPSAAPGTFAVDLTCRSGSTATTTLTITGSNAVPSTATMGPHTGGGYLATGGPGSRSPAVWIVGGLAAIGAAIAIGTASVPRHRRAVRVRARFRRR